MKPASAKPTAERCNPDLTIGFVCSTNGGAFRAIHQIVSDCSWDCQWLVATDRDCGIEQYCLDHDIRHRRFADLTNESFSRQAASWFSGKSNSTGAVDFVMLFYSRLVTEALFGRLPTINFHPSLLPAFPGINAVGQAIKNRSRFLGATAHLVDAGIDSGPIIAQACDAVDLSKSQSQWEHASFLQKVELGLTIIQLVRAGSIQFSGDLREVRFVGPVAASVSCNPGLTDPELKRGFEQFRVEQFGVELRRVEQSAEVAA